MGLASESWGTYIMICSNVRLISCSAGYFSFAALSPTSILHSVFHDLYSRRLPCPLTSGWVWPTEALGRSMGKRE